MVLILSVPWRRQTQRQIRSRCRMKKRTNEREKSTQRDIISLFIGFPRPNTSKIVVAMMVECDIMEMYGKMLTYVAIAMPPPLPIALGVRAHHFPQTQQSFARGVMQRTVVDGRSRDQTIRDTLRLRATAASAMQCDLYEQWQLLGNDGGGDGAGDSVDGRNEKKCVKAFRIREIFNNNDNNDNNVAKEMIINKYAVRWHRTEHQHWAVGVDCATPLVPECQS